MAESVKWRERGARINSISPGIIVTPLAIDEFNGIRGDFYKNMFAKCPAGRPGTADEVANVAELLMTEKGAFITGADLFKVEPAKPYSKNYKACYDEALEEKRRNARPELKEYLANISDYEVICIGSPIYWGTMPMSMFTQLEKLYFTGKLVKVFTTHEGSGLGNVVSDVKKICKGANVLDSLAIQGSLVHESKGKVENWIK